MVENVFGKASLEIGEVITLILKKNIDASFSFSQIYFHPARPDWS